MENIDKIKNMTIDEILMNYYKITKIDFNNNTSGLKEIANAQRCYEIIDEIKARFEFLSKDGNEKIDNTLRIIAWRSKENFVEVVKERLESGILI